MQDIMQYPSLKVASEIARICRAERIHYNNTKLQKLLYCCYGCCLVAFDARICDEYPKAWQYGPVFPRVFRYMNKGKDILSPDLTLNAPEFVQVLLRDVVLTFGQYTAGALSNWTHEDGSPWAFVVKEMEEPNGTIPDDKIRQYFIAQGIISPSAQC